MIVKINLLQFLMLDQNKNNDVFSGAADGYLIDDVAVMAFELVVNKRIFLALQFVKVKQLNHKRHEPNEPFAKKLRLTEGGLEKLVMLRLFDVVLMRGLPTVLLFIHAHFISL